MSDKHYDVIVVGSGPGGGSVAHELAKAGAEVLILERGDYLPSEQQNWDADAVFNQHRYKSGEFWWDARQSRRFRAGVHYWVGGNSKMYGAALTRMRREDFGELAYPDGTSPGWPIGYDDLRPFYARAEELFRVHGGLDEDRGEPEHDGPYPFERVAHESYVARMASDFASQGLRPVHLPMAIDLRDGGRCVYCSTCDGFPCRVRAKSDAEVCLIEPALRYGNVTLRTNAKVTRLKTDGTGRAVSAVECVVDGQPVAFTADKVVVSCGAVNSAVLLLQSANADHPAGLGNRSGQLGRNYMMNNNAVVLGLDPRRRNRSVFQKTLVLNDWYLGDDRAAIPQGSAQLIGKMQGSMLKGSMPLIPARLADWVAAHTHEWWLLTEDLPDPDNRVTVGDDGTTRIHYTPNNRVALHRLVKNLKKALRKAGFPIVIAQYPGLEITSHQAGTARFGLDPKTSVLDPLCRSHDVENLYVVDGSFLPSLPAMGPTLTIIAQGLRVGRHIAQTA